MLPYVRDGTNCKVLFRCFCVKMSSYLCSVWLMMWPSCFRLTRQAAYSATHHEILVFIDLMVTGGGLELYRRFSRDTDTWPTFSRIPALLSIPHTDLISHLWKHAERHRDPHLTSHSIVLCVTNHKQDPAKHPWLTIPNVLRSFGAWIQMIQKMKTSSHAQQCSGFSK